MRKLEIRLEPVESFFERGRKTAILMDQHKPIPPRFIVAFEEVEDLLRVLTVQRVSLLKTIKEAPGSISDLARKLKRDRSAVTRDIQVLESYGVIHVTEKTLPGHGTQKWITPAAREIQLVADF